VVLGATSPLSTLPEQGLPHLLVQDSVGQHFLQFGEKTAFGHHVVTTLSSTTSRGSGPVLAERPV
jgi:hypothetical protein